MDFSDNLFKVLKRTMAELESLVEQHQNDFGADEEVAAVLGGGCLDVPFARGLSSGKSRDSRDSTSSSNMDSMKIKSETTTPGSESSYDSETAQYPSLHFLAAQGEVLKIKEELERGVDVNITDKQGLTPLIWAAAHRQKATVSLLLEHNADPNKEGLGGETPLLFAASQGQCDIIDQLLHSGADIDHIDMNGGIALMYAVYNGFPEVVKKLLENGADLTIKNENDQTCYSLAATLGNKTVKHIIEDYVKGILENVQS